MLCSLRRARGGYVDDADDDDDGASDDEDADPEEDLGTANAVLVGWGGGAMPPALSVEEWAEAAALGRAASPRHAARPPRGLPLLLQLLVMEIQCQIKCLS